MRKFRQDPDTTEIGPEEDSGSSYGGFSTKWEYEAYRRKKEEKSARLRRTTVGLTVGFFVGIGILITAVAVVALRFPDEHSASSAPDLKEENTAAESESPGAQEFSKNVISAGNVLLAADRTVISDRDSKGFRLGISGVDIDKDTAYRYRIPRGIMVHSVDETMPAYVMGIAKNDIIVSINDVRIYSMPDLIRRVEACSIDDEVITVGVYRGESQMTLSMFVSCIER